jgi:hypothetical protein
MSPPGGGAAGGPEVSPSGVEAVLGSSSLPGQPGRGNHHGRAGPPAGRSLALQALYENDAVKRAIAEFDQRPMTFDSCLDDDNDDDNDDNSDDEEESMDPITYLRHYSAGNPVLMKVVQDHDQKERERINQEIRNWMAGVQSETP